jgi:nitrite reductase (NADH) large subunit
MSLAPKAPGISETVVVVGNGMVGYRFCRTLVERGGHERYRVIVVGEESQPAYDRVHLTELFAGKSPDDLTLAPPAWYEEHGLDLYLGDRIVAIDREKQIIRSAAGRGIPYDTLILATGSRPVAPSMKGTELSGVFRYRTVDDLSAMLEYARTVSSAAVLGGGLARKNFTGRPSRHVESIDMVTAKGRGR